MSRLFISHSSKDNFEAIAFHDWLVSEGWNAEDIFIDLHDIAPGAKWKEALTKANERCEAVVLLASPASLASTECRLEIRMAEDYGKEIIVAILYLLSPENAELGVYRERQIVDLSLEPRDAIFTVEHKGQKKAVAFSQRTLRHIKSRLDQLGISPTSFSWRPKDLETASPYPGFEGFTQNEAALFFGRAGDIARGLADLRKLRRLGAGQIMVVQAASGAGKSSFLKAGLWPRLTRDPDFLPLGILRPATGILTGETGLGRQLAAFFGAQKQMRTAAEFHQRLRGTPDAAAEAVVALINEATEIGHAIQRVSRPDAPLPTPVLAVDQAEELFGAADGEESRRFLEIVSRVLAPERHQGAQTSSRLIAPPLFLWTIRADSVDTLLQVTDKAGIKPPHPFLLPPIPRDAYREIIEAPLAIANQAGMKVAIDPLLVDALVETSVGADALPLLAFTLRQLLAENRSGGTAQLTLDQFQAAGGMEGILSKRLATAQGAAGTSSEKLRRLFIPHLATWDEEAKPPAAKRLVAEEGRLLSGERSDLKPLADALVEARLLTRSGTERGQTTLEVAHEALLRLQPLSDWLAEDREFLVWRDRLGKARTAYEANTRGLLVGRELQIARDWLEARADPDDIAPKDRDFVVRSIAEEEHRRSEEEDRERKRQAAELAAAKAREAAAELEAKAAAEMAEASRRLVRRTIAGLFAALVLAVAAGGAGLYAWKQQNEAKTQARLAEELRDEAQMQAGEARRQAAAAEAATGEAEKLAGVASRWLVNSANQLLDKTDRGDAGSAALLALEVLPDEDAGIKRPYLAEAEFLLDRATWQLRERAVLAGHTDRLRMASFSGDGTRIVTASEDGTARIWDRASGRELIRFGGHQQFADTASFSSDGTRVLSKLSDDTAAVWDAATGAEIAHLTGHTATVWSAVFSTDGTRAVTASDDDTARIWDAATGKELFRLEGHQGDVADAAFDTTGARVVTASWDGTARVWDAKTGIVLTRLEGHADTVRSAAFSADGTRIVTASQDGTARIWDAATGKEITRLEAESETVGRASFDPEGRRVVTMHADKKVRVWDLDSGKELVRLEGHQDHLISAEFSTDGSRVVTVSEDATVRVWDPAVGQELARLAGHQGLISSAAFSADGKHIVTASSDNTARVWDAETERTGRELVRLAGHEGTIRSAAFNAEGTRVVTGADDNRARLWDASTGELLFTLEGHLDWIRSVAFSPDGRQVATGSDDAKARIWDVATGKEIVTLEGHQSSLTSVAFDHDGKRLVTGSWDSTVRVWDALSGKVLARLEGHQESIRSAVFSRDGARILTASDDNTARVWDAATGKELIRLDGHQDDVVGAAFDANGGRVVTASTDNTARVWDAASGRELARLEGHEGDVIAASFDTDGKRIVTGSADYTGRVWDAATGQELARLVGSQGSIVSAAFNQDGTRIVTASDDSTARIWETLTGQELARIAGHEYSLMTASFSADGGRVLTASADRTARIWKVFPNTQDLVNEAKGRVRRCLSPEQRKSNLLPDKPPAWCTDNALWPYDSASRVVRANSQLKEKDPKRAVAECSAALQQAMPGAQGDWVRWLAYFTRGRAHDMAGDHRARDVDFAEAQRLNVDISAYFLSKAAELDPKKVDDTLAILTEAVSWASRQGAPETARPTALFARAKAYDAAGKSDKATQDFLSAGPTMLADIVSYYSNKAVWSNNGPGSAEALAAHDEAVKWASREGSTPEIKARALFERGVAYAEAKRDNDAAADFEAAAPAALGDIIEYYAGKARTAGDEGKSDEAVAAADKALHWASRDGATGDQRSYAHFVRGQAYAVANEKDKSNQDFEAALPARLPDVVKFFSSRAEALRQEGKTDDALLAYGEAVSWASREGSPPEIRTEALFERGKAYDAANRVTLAAADFEAAGTSKLPEIVSHYLEKANTLIQEKKADEAFSAASLAVQWSSREGVSPADKSNAYLTRGRALMGKEEYLRALADFEEARALGHQYGAVWALDAKMGQAQSLESTKPADALLLALPSLLDLDQEARLSILNDKRNWYSTRIAYPIAQLYAQLASQPAAPPTECDRLTAHPSDPFRAAPGVLFDSIADAAAAVDVCTKDLETADEAIKGRLLLQRARANSKAAEVAEAAGKDDDAKRYTEGKFADLAAAMKRDYPMAFNNQAYTYDWGDGIAKDDEKAADLYLVTLNHMARCCGPTAVRHLLQNEGPHDRERVRKVVAALTHWSAELGSAEAHELLAEMALDGRLAMEDGVAPQRFAYEHLLIAAKLRTAERKPEAAKAYEAKAAAIAELSQADKEEASGRVTAFQPAKISDLPPWLRLKEITTAATGR